MSDKLKHFFGLRKSKSILALFICFLLWQIVRIIIPHLDTHPTYAYMYAIIEMRNSIETAKRTGSSRLKANLIGFLVAFAAIVLTDFTSGFGFASPVFKPENNKK